MDYAQLLGALVITAVIAILIFLVTREFWCWYWKINEQIEIAKRSQLLLTALCEAQRLQDPDKRAAYIKKTLWSE